MKTLRLPRSDPGRGGVVNAIVPHATIDAIARHLGLIHERDWSLGRATQFMQRFGTIAS